MRRITSLLGAVTLSAFGALNALSLNGCYTEKEKEMIKAEALKPKSYFSEIPMHHGLSTASVAITSGDFDKDGDLDIVVAGLDNNGTRLYFFENDGNGIFRLNRYPVE